MSADGGGSDRSLDSSLADASYHSQLLSSISTACPSFGGVYSLSCINPFPYAVSPSEFASYAALYHSFRDGIHALVAADSRGDATVRRRLDITEASRALVDRIHASGTPYRIGCFRPDYVVDLDGTARVCEINARFALNGYLCTPIGADALERLGVIRAAGAIPACRPTDHVVNSLLYPFDAAHPVHVVKGREHGYSVHLLADVSPRHKILFVSPLDLAVDGDGVLVDTRDGARVRQMILELHQDELLSLPPSVLDVLCDPTRHGVIYVNDLRTILLVHDKRFLSLLSDASFMSDLIGRDAAARLARHVIPTAPLSALADDAFAAALLAAARADRHGHIVKPALLGKGEGILFGKDAEGAREGPWREALQGGAAGVVQPYVAQRVHSLRVAADGGYIVSRQKAVGTLLCTEEAFLGLGIFRSAPEREDLVAISRGGCMLFPAVKEGTPMGGEHLYRAPESLADGAAIGDIWKACDGAVGDKSSGDAAPFMPADAASITSSHDVANGQFSNDVSFSVLGDHGPLAPPAPYPAFPLPADCYLSASSPSADLVSACRRLLDSRGLAIVRVDLSADAHTQFMTTLVNQLGAAEGHDIGGRLVWDVRFTSGGIARSHNMDEFPMHTDCSYEDPAPRYIALLVLRADAQRQGVSRLVRVADVLAAMPAALVDALRRPCFKYKVPPEFYRGKATLTAPVLMGGGDDLMRFREDIVSVDEEAAGESAGVCGEALRALSDIVRDEERCRYRWLPEGHLMLLDNARYLHGRTPFEDPNRHLQRMRFF